MMKSVFKPIPKWGMAQARQHIAEHPIDSYNLVDVRQPEEYAEGHIPGATLLPLGEVEARAGELDRDKLTLVYCRSGGRAGNATALLSRAGFADVHNIGGFMEWQGLAASGAPEAAMAVFDPAHTAAEHVALAWVMEDNAIRFYRELAPQWPELTAMLESMAEGEQHHRDQLDEVYRSLTGEAIRPPAEDAGLMEGGIPRDEAVAWAREHSAADFLELAAALEANAHDRYVVVGRALGGDTERAFVALADAEKRHLRELLDAFTARLAATR